MNENLGLKIMKNNINLLVLLKLYKKNKKKLRRWWVKPHLKEGVRIQFGVYHTIFLYFKLEDHEEFQKMFRLNVDDFEYLFDLLKNKIKKKDTHLRNSIPPELRLAYALWILTQGTPPKQTSLIHHIGKSTGYCVLYEVCKAIIDVLGPIYAPMPNTPAEWIEISKQFWEQWHFPNCGGALDGKHVLVECPENSGSAFFSLHKKRFSINLMALADADKRFIWYNVGDYGSLNDASILLESDFYQLLTNNNLGLPSSMALPNTDIKLPIMFVADEIFALHHNIMKPFSKTPNLSIGQRVFNYRLKRARLNIECAFGILTETFQILSKNISFKLENSRIVVGATICLHNFKITRKLQHRIRNHYDYEFLNENVQMSAIQQRLLLTKYFMSTFGKVPWQEQCI